MMDKHNERSGWIPSALTVVFLLLDALLAVFLAETVWRQSYNQSLYWMLTRLDASCLCVLIVFLVLLGLTFLLRRACVSVALVNVLMGFLATAEYFKYSLRSEVLLVTDVQLFGEATGILGKYNLDFPKMMLISFALLSLPVVLAAPLYFSKCRWRFRIPVFLLCLVLTVPAFLRFDTVCYQKKIFSQLTYYEEGGLIGGLTYLRPKKLEKPENYSEEAVNQALQEENSGSQPTAAAEIQPDVILIMCESLYDPLKLQGISCSEDPLANFRQLQREGIGGELAVSQYGGGTAQTEYEVLTGYRAADTVGNAFVSTEALPEGMSSIVTMLKGEGYRTAAMHPSQGSFYNREKAYQKIGFDETVFIDSMSEPDRTIGGVPADSWFFREILKQYDAMPEDQPRMIHVVTYQNHGEYDYPQEVSGITVTGLDNEKDCLHAENYVNGIHATDEALPILFDAFRKSDRPVIVVMFGDHSPTLDQIGVSLGEDDASVFSAYTTPYLIWSNRELEIPDTQNTVISSYRLGACALRIAGLCKDSYFYALGNPVGKNLFFRDGMMVTDSGLVQDEEQWNDESQRLQLLHYDRLNGENWWKAVQLP